MKNKGPFPKWCFYLPNLLTTVNITMGVLAILLLIGPDAAQRRGIACVFILVGALADTLDGKAARFFGAESAMGKQLDSFADSITFGLAPAATVSSFPAVRQAPWLLVVLTLYTMAGFFRLARFNLGDFSHYFLGLPITVAGSIVALFALILDRYDGVIKPALSTMLIVALLLLLSLLMVSQIRINRPKLGNKGV